MISLVQSLDRRLLFKSLCLFSVLHVVVDDVQIRPKLIYGKGLGVRTGDRVTGNQVPGGTEIYDYLRSY